MNLEKALEVMIGHITDEQIEKAAPEQKLYYGCHPAGFEVFVIKSKRNLNKGVKTLEEMKAEIAEKTAELVAAWEKRLG